MRKSSLLLVLGLTVIAVSAAVPKANAGVVFQVGVGAPVYGYPVPAYGYVEPPYVPYGTSYFEPGYVAPYVVVRPGAYYRRAYVGLYREGWHERWEDRRYEGRRFDYRRDRDDWRR